MKIKNLLKLLLFGAIFAIQCKNVPQKSSSELEEPLFYIKTTECMGTCPVYTFTVFANRTSSYEGVANVDKHGLYTSTLSSEQLNELKENLSDINFLNLEIKNSSLHKDLPTTYLYFKDGDSERKITYYSPKNAKVDSLIESVNALINNLEWKSK